MHWRWAGRKYTVKVLQVLATLFALRSLAQTNRCNSSQLMWWLQFHDYGPCQWSNRFILYCD